MTTDTETFSPTDPLELQSAPIARSQRTLLRTFVRDYMISSCVSRFGMPSSGPMVCSASFPIKVSQLGMLFLVDDNVDESSKCSNGLLVMMAL